MERVLIVDDNAVNLKMAKGFLADICKPFPVNSGAAALRFLDTAKPALIFLDVLMPDMDGFETLTEIRNKENGKDVPVVFLTADESQETKDKALALGITDFVSKPIDGESLKAVAMKYLG